LKSDTNPTTLVSGALIIVLRWTLNFIINLIVGTNFSVAHLVELADDMWPSKGYTIINAKDMDAAVAIAKECPMLEDDDKGTVRMYEALPM
jgi:hypothetical protein